MYIFMLSRSQFSVEVLDGMVTHSSITYLLFALDFLLDLVCTSFWAESPNGGFGMDRKY